MLIVVLVVMVIFAISILIVMLTEMTNFVQTRVPFVPTAKADLVFMIERAGITADDNVYDLGSGNGKVVFAMNNLAGARAKGFQRGGWTQWYAKLRQKLGDVVSGKKSEVEFVTGNFFDYSWSDATVVYGYLYPFLMQSVEDKALADCKPGTKIVVRDFNLPTLTHTDTWKTPTGHTMYLYLL